MSKINTAWMVLTTTGATWIAGSPSLPIMLSAIGVIGLGISGWLGGELVFKHGVAVTVTPKVATAPEKPEKRRHVTAA